MTDTSIIIPARMGSSRFKGKPLVKILNFPMIIHVWKRCNLIKNCDVYIATCDVEIKEICENYGAKVIMTSKKHKMCMDRVAEASKKVKSENIITVQGDEPLVRPNMILQVIKKMKYHDAVTLMQKVKLDNERADKNRVKVVYNKLNDLLYISRETIPTEKVLNKKKDLYKLVNIFGFKKKFLKNYNKLKSDLELRESVDLLRVIDNGYKIKIFKTNGFITSVDVPNDLKIVKKFLKIDKIYKKISKLS
jgi:3-deoxy-manno-octulosonate cytidylyltransferase (CMP-KDO synthetase)